MPPRHSSATCSGFTLIELLVVVAIIGVLAAIGIPAYQNYLETARASAAQNGLRSIYLAQKEHFSENNAFYGTATGDQTASLNTNLFAGNKTLDAPPYYYYVTCTPAATPCTTGYTAFAQKTGGTIYTITNFNVRTPAGW